MAALRSRCGHYIFVLWFLLSFFLYSSPNISRRRLGVYHTSTQCHNVALVRMSEMCCRRLAEKYRTQKIAEKSISGHHSTTLFGYIFATKACIDNQKKKLLNSNISSTWSHNTANFGPITAQIGVPVSDTLPNFNGFRVLASLYLLQCSDVAHRRPTKLCTIFGRLLGWYTIYIFWGSLPLAVFCPVQN